MFKISLAFLGKHCCHFNQSSQTSRHRGYIVTWSRFQIVHH